MRGQWLRGVVCREAACERSHGPDDDGNDDGWPHEDSASPLVGQIVGDEIKGLLARAGHRRRVDWRHAEGRQSASDDAYTRLTLLRFFTGCFAQSIATDRLFGAAGVHWFLIDACLPHAPLAVVGQLSRWPWYSLPGPFAFRAGSMQSLTGGSCSSLEKARS